MTLDEFIAQYTNQVIGDGECGTLVRQYLIEVDGYTPPSHPSAKDYWTYGMPGYNKSSSPTPGCIVVYNGHGPTLPDGTLAYPDGHIAVYVDGRVFEQNADPDGAAAHLFNRANTYLLGYLVKEQQPMNETISLEIARLIAYFFLGRNGVTNAVNALAGQCDDDLNQHMVGGVFDEPFIRAMYNSQESQEFRAKLGTLTASPAITKQVVLDYINKNLN